MSAKRRRSSASQETSESISQSVKQSQPFTVKLIDSDLQVRHSTRFVAGNTANEIVSVLTSYEQEYLRPHLSVALTHDSVEPLFLDCADNSRLSSITLGSVVQRGLALQSVLLIKVQCCCDLPPVQIPLTQKTTRADVAESFLQVWKCRQMYEMDRQFNLDLYWNQRRTAVVNPTGLFSAFCDMLCGQPNRPLELYARVKDVARPAVVRQCPRSNQPEFPILVKTMTRKTLTLDVTPDDTVLELKRRFKTWKGFLQTNNNSSF